MIKLLDIDTNNENAWKFENNLELFDLIAPNIICLIDNCGEVYLSEVIDWDKTRPYFEPTNNGHCVYLKEGVYMAAYKFNRLIIRLDDLDIAEAFPLYTLSHFCNALAEKYNIKSWIIKQKN